MRARGKLGFSRDVRLFFGALAQNCGPLRVVEPYRYLVQTRSDLAHRAGRRIPAEVVVGAARAPVVAAPLEEQRHGPGAIGLLLRQEAGAGRGIDTVPHHYARGCRKAAGIERHIVNMAGLAASHGEVEGPAVLRRRRPQRHSDGVVLAADDRPDLPRIRRGRCGHGNGRPEDQSESAKDETFAHGLALARDGLPRLNEWLIHSTGCKGRPTAARIDTARPQRENPSR